MDPTIYRYFDRLISAPNSQTVPLIKVAIRSCDYDKAIALSEHLIQSNHPQGWITKSIAEAASFDYETKFPRLQSALSSYQQFTNSIQLTSHQLMQLDAVFTQTLLENTIKQVRAKMMQIDQLKAAAKHEKFKSNLATAGTVVGVIAGTNAKTKAGKYLGYGGAVVGYIASKHFQANAQLITNSAKGVFAETVANVASSIDYASQVKNDIQQVDPAIRSHVQQTTQEYIQVIAEVYNRVIENFLLQLESTVSISPLSGRFAENVAGISNSMEGSQFLYFSQILGMKNSIPEYSGIEQEIKALPNIDKAGVKSEAAIMKLMTWAIGVLAILLIMYGDYSSFESHPGTWALITCGAVYIFFRLRPMGKSNALKKRMRLLQTSLIHYANRFKSVIP
jgi:hypothetical protein